MRPKERLTIPHVKQLARKILFRLLAIAVVLTIVEVALGVGLQVWSCNLNPNRASTASTVFCREKFAQWWFTRLVTLNPSNYFQEYCTNSRNETYIGETAWARRYDRDWMIDHRMRASICWVDRSYDGTMQASETDRWGFVYSGPENDLETLNKDMDTIRIIVLGGSTVEGLGADSVKSIPAYLYQDLKAKYPSRKFQVINAGVGGFDSKYQIVYFAGELIHLNPNLVIFYDGFNDYYGITPRVASNPYLNRDTTDRTQIDTVGGALKSVLANMRYSIFESISHWSRYSPTVYLIAQVGRRLTEGGKPLAILQSENALRAEAVYIKNIRSFLGICQAHGIKCAHILQPQPFSSKRLTVQEQESIARGYLPGMEKTFNLFYEYARQDRQLVRTNFADSRRFILADVSDVFNDHPETLYVDLGHLNARGNQLVAQRITAEIASLMNALVSSRK